ncbi:60S ribosomal subunit assembly/export protein [Taxawa tesnikishii (nom. ined.)]|nr:60S ribosomal subunit assembly/export protein [Dothideales sp. JES 119]
MAPTKVKTGSAKGQNKRSTAPSKSGSSSKIKKVSSGPKPKPVEQKKKSAPHGPAKKKKRVYTEKELGVPTLNSIKPAGVQKPRGVKKGKTFVDDKESMMTILAMVQAEKEGNIESKMMRARQMEEIREARRAEAEKREQGRKEKLEGVKNEIKNRKKNNKAATAAPDSEEAPAAKPKKKRVSFG